MTTTVTILRNADRNYDRLFKMIDAGSCGSCGIGGRVNSLSERQTAAGYEVTFSTLGADLIARLADLRKDYAVS